MRVFSGIQPTGAIHIGNYLGAIKQFLELQEKAECVFSIVDLHAITIPYQSQELQKNILDAAVCYLAAGINPEKSILFVQSSVKEHTELAWLLGTLCPIGDLLRMTQYKEKSKEFKGTAGAGILNYPILMAADILLYKTEVVPVGKDQKQHVELTRTIARRFNKLFGKTLIEPEVKLQKVGAKIMALNNPRKKMSKSIPESCLYLFDEPDVIKKKIMAAVTDPGKIIKYDLQKKPGISNLLTIYSLFSRKSIKELEKKFKSSGYERFKKSLAELLINSLESFRRKRKELLAREVYVKEILEQGRKRAQIIAQSTMAEVSKRMGLS
ncbi:MAG: tryptophan--tRNA ligase [Candidatus Nealsonbacteria bacterium CG_4_9_14_3_um_filter_37_13]|uniref:Tryptophan--tRNA ligase n=1 Tax=Candidatus Nealsonbacteria bacterium CG_4_9_14_3_um_filter_37_13 TaxID=1974695 RepID=A0A2M7Z467_9BACT|nr:MAG: tryptophan--tRNA ligase [Candidatus Nealsonbacteria bacterium CG_4_9_14_3_um_filter_37_13]